VRVLLDECLPRRLKRELVGHDTRTGPEMGWASKRNGELLALAVGQLEVFLTADRNATGVCRKRHMDQSVTSKRIAA
jgi:hypothetical protein